ncbi:MAG: hypothetical protein BWY59_00873 [Verrucomicrobia bacterium ADurb.Bin345]|nr:MAG: hypothetical protein BWY59_00873 [Verrucomicrobia bacterium ADurb.Bin345]
MFAPNIGGMDSSRVIKPALIRPTIITVAALVWIVVPRKAPSSRPFMR